MPKSGGRPLQLSEPALDLVARRFRVLADPARLRLLSELLRGERAVQDLAERTGLPQPTVSKQLAILRGEGFIARRREAQQAFYRVADASVAELCEIVCRGVAERLAGDLEALPEPRSAPAHAARRRS
jgi:DNA-binding transcriptional ArsR family regulator